MYAKKISEREDGFGLDLCGGMPECRQNIFTAGLSLNFSPAGAWVPGWVNPLWKVTWIHFKKKNGAGLAIHMRENVYKKNLPCQHSWSISQNPDQKKISFGSLGALCSFDEIEFVILNDI